MNIKSKIGALLKYACIIICSIIIGGVIMFFVGRSCAAGELADIAADYQRVEGKLNASLEINQLLTKENQELRKYNQQAKDEITGAGTGLNEAERNIKRSLELTGELEQKIKSGNTEQRNGIMDISRNSIDSGRINYLFGGK